MWFTSTEYNLELEGQTEPHAEILRPINEIFETKRHANETNEKCNYWSICNNIERIYKL